MARVLTITILSILCGVTPAAAQEPLIGVDGCGILATLVYTEVTESGLRRASGPGSTLMFPSRGDVTICNHMARTVTRAFTRSMQQMNIYISWGPHNRGSGDYCYSHYLDQCYPDNSPFMPPMSGDQFAFVARKWRAVRLALAPTVRAGVEGEVLRFEQRELRIGLRNALTRQARVAR